CPYLCLNTGGFTGRRFRQKAANCAAPVNRIELIRLFTWLWFCCSGRKRVWTPALPAAFLPLAGGATMPRCEAIMNVRPDLHMSKAAFLDWDAGEGQRCELVGGRVVMMARPSRNHGKIVMNLGVHLNAKLDPKQWDVIMEFGLDTGPETLRYPDVV